MDYLNKILNINNSWSIDSFNIYIPIKKIQFTERGKQELSELIGLVNLQTGEILNTSKNRKIFVEKNGIKVYALYVNLFGDKYISIGVSSKLLKNNYLAGITWQTFMQLYSELIDFVKPFFFFEKETFLKSIISDVDFKLDLYESETNILNFGTLLKKTVNDTRFFYTVNIHKVRHLTGLQVGSRAVKSEKYLFFKVYNKKSELESRSEEFYKKYVTTIDKDLWRFEFTLSNTKHFTRYLNNNNKGYKATLTQMLDEIKRIPGVVREILKNYLEDKKFSFKKKFEKNQFTANELILYSNYIHWKIYNPLREPKDFLNDVIMPFQILRENYNVKSAKVFKSRLIAKINKMNEFFYKKNMFFEL